MALESIMVLKMNSLKTESQKSWFDNNIVIDLCEAVQNTQWSQARFMSCLRLCLNSILKSFEPRSGLRPSPVRASRSSDSASRRVRRSTAGFTLLELLVVITILAIMAGAALPYVQGYVEESRVSKAKADLEEISKAIQIYESREREYTASSVHQLVGRYLNKSPIDPWGRQYFVSTLTATVFSAGPDRNPGTEEDNIVAYYAPPLALTQATWIDANNSGAVDAQNTPDYIRLRFTRPLRVVPTTPGSFAFSGLSLASSTAVFNWPAVGVLTGSRTMILPIRNPVPFAEPFVVGSDTIAVVNNNEIVDMAGDVCLSEQLVTIRSQ